MKRFNILALLAAFALIFAVGGCGKKDKPKDKPVEPTKPAEPDKTPKAVELGPEFEEGLVLTEKFADVMDAAKDDCKKLTEEMTTFYEANKDGVAKGMEVNKKLAADPALLKKYEEKYGERTKAALAKQQAAIAAKCATDEGLQKALQEMMAGPADPAEDPAKQPAEPDEKKDQ